MVTTDYAATKFFGLSGDTKPTVGVSNGSSYQEIDTGKVFLFDEEDGSWIEQGAQE